MAQEVVRNINININGKEVVNSMAGITKAMREVNRDIRNLNKNDSDYTEQLKVHNARITELKAKQKEFREEIYGTSKALKESKKDIDAGTFSFQNFMGALMSGDVQGLHEEFKLLGNGIGNVTKQALAFIATPIGAAITVLTGIVVATKYWYDYNTEMEKSLKVTKQFTGLAGEELEAVGVKVNGIVERTGATQKEVLTAVQALVNDFGLSYDEAFKKINLGYERAGSSAEDFFDNTAEYSTFLAQAGYNADEFFAIMEAGAQNGVYKDKILDSLKEVDVRLKEMPQSAADALTNAFGQNFSDSISKGVKSGEINTKTALDLINKEADKTGLNFQQKGQLIADVFGAAGEDAGGFKKVIDTVTQGLDKAGAELTEVEQAQMASVEAQDEMNQAFADLFHSTDGGFSVMKAQLMEGVYKAITYVVNGVIKGYNWFVNLYNSSQAFAGTMNTIGAIGKMVFNSLITGIKNVGTGLSGLGDIVGAIFKGEFSEIPSIFKTTMGKIQLESAKTTKQIADDFVDAWNGKNPKLKTIEKNTVENVVTNTTENDFTGGGNNNGGGSGNKAKKDKDVEAEKKYQEEIKKLWEKGEKEISDILARSREERELQLLQGIAREEKVINNKYDGEVAKIQESIDAINAVKVKDNTEQLAKAQALTDRLKEIEAAREADLEALRANNRAESLLRANELEEENRIAKAEAEAELEAEKITNFEERALFMLQKQQEIAEMELEIERNKVLEKARINGASAEEIAAINEGFELRKQKMQRDSAKAEERLKSDQVKWTELTEEQKLNSVKGALNSAAEAFNEGSGAWKATKIAETVITTYQSATNAFNSLSGIPIVGPALGAAAAALAVVSGIKNVQKISQTPLQKMPTHYYGGYTGNASGQFGGDEYGQFTGAVHANEWVAPAFMAQSPRYAPIIDWLDNERQMQLNGVAGSTSNPFFDNPVFSLLAGAVMQLNDNLENGIVAKSFFGYEEVEKMEKLQKELQQTKQNAIISE